MNFHLSHKSKNHRVYFTLQKSVSGFDLFNNWVHSALKINYLWDLFVGSYVWFSQWIWRREASIKPVERNPLVSDFLLGENYNEIPLAINQLALIDDVATSKDPRAGRLRPEMSSKDWWMNSKHATHTEKTEWKYSKSRKQHWPKLKQALFWIQEPSDLFSLKSDIKH